MNLLESDIPCPLKRLHSVQCKNNLCWNTIGLGRWRQDHPTPGPGVQKGLRARCVVVNALSDPVVQYQN